MNLYRILLFVCLFFLVAHQGFGQDTLVVQGTISTSTASSVNSVNISITYYDSATVLFRDTVLTTFLGFYSDTFINSNTNKVVVQMEKCTATNTFYPKSINIPPWTGLQIQVVNFTNFCFNANFSYFINASTVSFTSLVNGGISPYQYHWNFGDGNIDSVANPNHFYNTGGPLYQVSLTVTDTMGDSVITSQQINIQRCISSFSWIHNGGRNVSFTDSASIPSSANRFWDFGDGDTSTSSNPNHTYLTTGLFNVCLTITDSGSFCTNTFCDVILVDTNRCTAQFSYQINQNIVRFFNQSTSTSGLNYEWDFDDGSGHSNDTSPSHIYSSNGIKNVSLAINDTLGCIDSAYQSVAISGIDPAKLIIAGEILIDGRVGEAKVSLINNTSGDYEVIDEMNSIDGKYSFNVNYNSTYYLNSRAIKLHPKYFQILPSYYDSTNFWQDATAIVISKDNSLHNNFDLIYKPPPFATSSIKGHVGTFIKKDLPNDPYEGADVILFDALGNFVTRDESDENGNYSLINLTPGNYLVYADVIGYTSAVSYRSIIQAGTSIEGVNFTIYPDKILNIKEDTQMFYQLNAYPNPAHNILNIEGNFKENLEWKIFSIDGKYYSCEAKGLTTKTRLEIDIEKLPTGYYIIELKDTENVRTLSFFKIN